MASPVDEKQDDTLTPRRLELSLSPEDGSLLTAPLSTVLLSSTNALYTDLYNMAHGELEVAQAVGPEEEEDAPHPSLKKEHMSNLSFAQRRHELAWRLAQHCKALSHVSALTAAAATSKFAHSTRVSTRALQHARTAWLQNDEAQDALYFFHAQLFPARQAPHDVFGALDLVQRGCWVDLPTDLKLVVDPYEKSRESRWDTNEVAERWNMAVTDKLLLGEVGWMQSQDDMSVPWRISLKGGMVRLTHGQPKMVAASQTPLYPLEAHLTVLSTSVLAEWTLLSVEVRAQAKTGESNHQLDSSSRQRYDLHKLCAMAMNREESRVRNGDPLDDGDVPRPLDCLFRVAHTFSLSWQLEILSAQAQALKRGVWSKVGGVNSSLTVAPVRFDPGCDQIGALCVAFWNVDDRYGPPCMGDLRLDVEPGNEETDSSPVSSKLALSIRADRTKGILVSLSGGRAILDVSRSQPHIRSTVERVLESSSSPFTLSISDALLAATTLCGERKSVAVVEALKAQSDDRALPAWVKLSTERGSIDVAAQLSYDGVDKHSSGFISLFRLGVDSRTGSFVCLFPRSTELLRLLVCNDRSASESMALQMAKLAQNGRKGAPAGATGRIVRDAFESLVRSINLLGQRVGVGGTWENRDDESASLRQRAIQQACGDTKESLVTCCGIASMFGLSALAIGVASGVTAVPDMTGAPLEQTEGRNYLPVPPLGVVMDHRVTQTMDVTNEGGKRKRSFVVTELLAVCCSISSDSLTLHALEITTSLDSPSSAPVRTRYAALPLQSQKMVVTSETRNENGERPSKRSRVESSSCTSDDTLLLDEVEAFASIIASTIHAS